jgi:hypothetical protein
VIGVIVLAVVGVGAFAAMRLRGDTQSTAAATKRFERRSPAPARTSIFPCREVERDRVRFVETKNDAHLQGAS